VPRLEGASGLRAEVDGDDGLLVAFSPERLFSGSALRNLAAYPKLVGGIGPRSSARAAAFYDSVLDADVVVMQSAEAAEFAKLADTTYRDVNIALANEFARVADRYGIDISEVIGAANSQPYSHIHQPGLGVGGHCIPVYPHFLLSGHQDLELVRHARAVNDGQVDDAVARIDRLLGGLAGQGVVVLGLTYRNGVKELAYSRGVALVRALGDAGARVIAFDPLLDPEEIRELGAEPWSWGTSRDDIAAAVTQTADPMFADLDASWFPGLRLVLDGRDSMRNLELPASVRYAGIGVPDRRR
jgi:UDP-N-acetyl-D-mannosaminuronic acid dehydrogenase